MRIVVLGSAGQIGGSLVEALHDQYSGEDDSIVEIDFATDFDLRHADSKVVEEIYKSDFVFFLAFDVGGSTYLREYQGTFDFIDNNVRIMENVFNILNKLQKPFFFASTQMSNMNHSPYGVLKRVGEFYTQAIGGISVKFWNVYGNEYDEEKFHVITDFINMAKNDQYIVMRTTGKEERQFLHAQDCSEALITLMRNYNGLTRDAYDISSFQWTSIENVAHCVASLYPGTLVAQGEEIDDVQGVRNEPNAAILSFWQPKISLVEGIKKVGDNIE